MGCFKNISVHDCIVCHLFLPAHPPYKIQVQRQPLSGLPRASGARGTIVHHHHHQVRFYATDTEVSYKGKVLMVSLRKGK